jgi:hypothetical protein
MKTAIFEGVVFVLMLAVIIGGIVLISPVGGMQ